MMKAWRQYFVLLVYTILQVCLADQNEEFLGGWVSGPLTPYRIQRSVIGFLVVTAGAHLLDYADLKNRAYPLEPLLRETRRRRCSQIPTRTIRRWFYYYMLEGEVPASRVIRNRRMTYHTKHHRRFRNNKKDSGNQQTLTHSKWF